MDPHAGGLGARAELAGDVVVYELVDDAKPDRLELPRGQLVERLVEPVQPGLVGLAHCLDGEAEPRAGGAFEPAASHGRDEDVPRDREQPRAGGAVQLVTEARAGDPCLRERLGGQVVGGLAFARAAEVVAVDAVGVPVVEPRNAAASVRAAARSSASVGWVISV